jgi:pterin-4a-carbinolamine dehydratase
MTEWKERERPLRLERRYTFADYEALRTFLEAASKISEALDYYPDMAFGRDHLNITIAPDEGDVLSEMHRKFAVDLDALGGYES